jgi:hypothetical protein
MEPVEEKTYQYLLHLVNTYDKQYLYEFVKHSQFFFSSKQVPMLSRYETNNKLTILADPDIFKKCYPYIGDVKKKVSKHYQDITGIVISDVDVHPELSRFQILQNNIVPVITPWEKINELQNNLIEDLRKANNTTDYQNIGNSSRTIMLHLASAVFNSAKHTAEGIDLSEGKFKNRLHTFIKVELGTNQDEELLKYISSIIETTEKAVDLTNKVTHDTKTDNLFAESCVIGVVTAISLIKLVNSKVKN